MCYDSEGTETVYFFKGKANQMAGMGNTEKTRARQCTR